MKSLRQGKKYKLWRASPTKCLIKKIELDNITYCTVITYLKKCQWFDRAIEWFERMYRTSVMPVEDTYSVVLDVYAKLGKREEVVGLYERAWTDGWKPDPIALWELAKMFSKVGIMMGFSMFLTR